MLLSTVFLIATDFAASRLFYTETLELKEASRAKDHVRYDLGSAALVVHAPIPDAEMRKWNLPPLREPRGAGVVVTLTPEDVDAAYERLLEKGVAPLFPPRDVPWGVRMFMVEDPSGFLIEMSRPLG